VLQCFAVCCNLPGHTVLHDKVTAVGCIEHDAESDCMHVSHISHERYIQSSHELQTSMSCIEHNAESDCMHVSQISHKLYTQFSHEL